VHTQVSSQLKGAKLELRELKAHSVEIKDLKHKLDHSSHYSVLSPPCEMCSSLMGKLFYATKENTELK
jgi:hypothetical protein